MLTINHAGCHDEPPLLRSLSNCGMQAGANAARTHAHKFTHPCMHSFMHTQTCTHINTQNTHILTQRHTYIQSTHTHTHNTHTHKAWNILHTGAAAGLNGK